MQSPIRSVRAHLTSESAVKEMEKIDKKKDWKPMDGGYIPIRSVQNPYTIRADFAGQGLETEGFEQAGYKVPVGADFDPWATVYSQRNHEGESTCADIRQVPAGYFDHTDIYVATPSCVSHTGARGKKDPTLQQEFWGEPVDLYAERDRALMEEVVKNTHDEILVRGKAFKYVVVENVREVANGKWPFFPRWVTDMRNIGYHVQILNLNGRFAHGRDFIAPGGDRDRIFIICSYRGYQGSVPIPDLDKIRPPAWCPNEEKPTNARQVWKDVPSLKGVPAELRTGAYGRQYIYCCQDCGKEAKPLTLAAIDHIDQSEPMVKIKDRADVGLPPLKPASMNRLRWAWAKVVLPALAENQRGGFDGATTAPDSLFTFTSESASRQKRVRGLDEHMPTLTERHIDVLGRVKGRDVASGGSAVDFGVSLNGGGSRTSARDITTEPGYSLLSGGDHFMLGRLPTSAIVANNNGEGEMARSLAEPNRTITTAGHQTFMRPPQDILALSPYYGKSTPRSLNEAAPTLTSRDRFMFLRLRAEMAAKAREIRDKYSFTLDDVPEDLFMETETRMITPDEGGSLMGANRGRWVGGNKRQQMSMHGRGVIVQAMRLIGEELLFTMHPETRPDDRMPDLDRIMAAQREPVLQAMQHRERIDVGALMGRRSNLLTVDNSDLPELYLGLS